MKNESISRFHGLLISSPDDWLDITDDLGQSFPPTLAKVDGIGALQFSVAQYRCGPLPNPMPEDLLQLTLDVGKSRTMVEPFSKITEQTPIRLGAASFQVGADFVRLWHVSGGANIVRITYTCDWGQEKTELPTCERIVRSIGFEVI